MAHMIVKGIDRMASTRLDTVWHANETAKDGRLTQVVARDPEATLLDMGGIVWPIDWDNDCVGTEQVQVVSTGRIVDTHVATVSRTGRVLGIVGADYPVVEFKFILTEWLLALARSGGMPETLGTYDAGASFFAAFQVAPEWRVPGDDSDTRPFCNIVSSHNGAGGIRSSFATFRVVCKNTSTMFRADHDRMDARKKAEHAWQTIAHSGNVHDRVKQAAAWIIDGRARAEHEQAMLERLAAKLLSPAQVQEFVDNYISIPDDASKLTIGYRTKARDKFRTDMTADDLGNHALTNKGITAYGLLQAVTHFEDWTSIARDGDAPVGTRRAFRAFLGERETEKSAARERILALVS